MQEWNKTITTEMYDGSETSDYITNYGSDYGTQVVLVEDHDSNYDIVPVNDIGQYLDDLMENDCVTGYDIYKDYGITALNAFVDYLHRGELTEASEEDLVDTVGGGQTFWTGEDYETIEQLTKNKVNVETNYE